MTGDTCEPLSNYNNIISVYFWSTYVHLTAPGYTLAKDGLQLNYNISFQVGKWNRG